MDEGSSPTTSESRSAAIWAGAAFRTSPPPLSVEMCLRTALISPISAPLLKSALLSCLRSSRAMPGAVSAKSADAPPEMRTSKRSPSSSSSKNSSTFSAAWALLSSGCGWEATRVSKVGGGFSWPALTTHRPPFSASPRTSSAARAIAPEALPIASAKTRRGSKDSPPTLVRPSSILKNRRTVLPGSAAASASARISFSSSFMNRYHKLPYEITQDAEEHYKSCPLETHQSYREHYEGSDQSPPLFVGPADHFPPLRLRRRSLHRNFDILYWYSLLFEHLPDVLLDTGRNLGEVCELSVTRRLHDTW